MLAEMSLVKWHFHFKSFIFQHLEKKIEIFKESSLFSSSLSAGNFGVQSWVFLHFSKLNSSYL
ncbi:hypothetical protein CsatB_023993 [Cannabis sativa]